MLYVPPFSISNDLLSESPNPDLSAVALAKVES
jgi:hypothetical protein